MKRQFKVKLTKEGHFVLPIDVRALYGEARPAVKMTVRRRSRRARRRAPAGKR